MIAAVNSRTRTTQPKLTSTVNVVDVIERDTTSGDSLSTDLDPNAVTLRGFNKRAGETKETFFVTNNTKHRISHIRLLLRYTTMSGAMLHERTVTVPVKLKPGETQMASIRSFDTQRLFYYFGSPKPRKAATPFKVAFKLIGYDIPIGE